MAGIQRLSHLWKFKGHGTQLQQYIWPAQEYVSNKRMSSATSSTSVSNLSKLSAPAPEEPSTSVERSSTTTPSLFNYVGETINITGLVQPFQECDECGTPIRKSDAVRHVWKCAFCRQYAICDSCYPKSKHEHPPHDKQDIFFRRELTHHLDRHRTSDHLLLAETFAEAVFRSCELSADRPALGWTAKDTQGFRWMTHGELLQRIQATARRLRELLSSSSSSSSDSSRSTSFCSCHHGVVMLVAENSISWIITYLACLYSHIIIVPGDASWSDQAVRDAVLQVRPNLVITSSARTETLEDVAQVLGLETVVDITTPREALPLFDLSARVRNEDDCIVSVSCTSGTTGAGNRGVLLSDAMLKQMHIDTVSPTDFELVTPVFLPLSSSTALSQTLHALCVGGAIGVISSPAALFDELPMLRPTVMSAPPSIWMLAQSLFESILQKSEDKNFNNACAELRARMGGNIRRVALGGARVDPELIKFLRKCFGKGIVAEGYGATECGSIAIDGRVRTGVSVKLLDVPELGFSQSDKPHPRGEVCIASSIPEGIASGYLWLGPESERDVHLRKTEDQFIQIEGKRYYRTGDIGELRSQQWGEPPQLVLLGRVKQFFKTPSGKFLSPEHIESALETACASWMRSILVSDSVPLVAVVRLQATTSPLSNDEALQRIHEASRSSDSLSNEEDLTQVYVAHTAADDDGLWFNKTHKKRRPHLLAHYRSTLVELQSKASRSRRNSVGTDGSSSWYAAFEQTLPRCRTIPNWASLSFHQLGGTSLQAMQIAARMHCPPTTAMNLLQAPSVEQFILSQLSSAGTSADSTSSSSLFFSSNSSVDWDTEMTVIDDFRLKSGSVLPSVSTIPQTILFTGATGFVGRFALAQLRISFPEAKIICLIRPSATETGRTRLERCLKQDELDTSLQHVTVLECVDLGLPTFGLDSTIFNQIVAKVTHVVHAAAHVHFVLPYRDLKHSNVDATKSLLRLCALAPNFKKFLFVSTGSTKGFKHPRETTSGYVQTKLVSEALVRSALPTSFRLIIHPVSVVGHSVTGVGTPPAGDWVATVWKALYERRMCPSPSVAMTLARETRLVAVDHVAEVVAKGLVEHSSEQPESITPGPVVITSLYAMTHVFPDQLVRVISDASSWNTWLQELPESSELHSHVPLLLVDPKSIEINKQVPIELPAAVSEHQRLWLQKCLQWLMQHF